jgi:hypothetical protein
MVFATLFPLGILQLYHSVAQGYYDARSLTFLTNHTNALIEWLRFPGDVLFIVGGAVPVLYRFPGSVSRDVLITNRSLCAVLLVMYFGETYLATRARMGPSTARKST